MRAGRPLALAVLVVAGCGGDRPQGVTVTEAEDPAGGPAARPSLAFDTVYTDSGAFTDPSLQPDSLRADSLRRDSLRADALRRDSLRRAARGPDFRTFWAAFQDAVRQDEPAVRALASYSDRLDQEAFEGLYEAAFVGEPFRSRVLALTPRDFARDGAAREVTVIVGYDAGGNVVPQDEAETEASLTLRFEVVEGTYRLVRVAPAG